MSSIFQPTLTETKGGGIVSGRTEVAPPPVSSEGKYSGLAKGLQLAGAAFKTAEAIGNKVTASRIREDLEQSAAEVPDPAAYAAEVESLVTKIDENTLVADKLEATLKDRYEGPLTPQDQGNIDLFRREADKYKKALSAKRFSPSEFAVRMENKMAEYYSKYPHLRSEISAIANTTLGTDFIGSRYRQWVSNEKSKGVSAQKALQKQWEEIKRTVPVSAGERVREATPELVAKYSPEYNMTLEGEIESKRLTRVSKGLEVESKLTTREQTQGLAQLSGTISSMPARINTMLKDVGIDVSYEEWPNLPTDRKKEVIEAIDQHTMFLQNQINSYAFADDSYRKSISMSLDNRARMLKAHVNGENVRKMLEEDTKMLVNLTTNELIRNNPKALGFVVRRSLAPGISESNEERVFYRTMLSPEGVGSLISNGNSMLKTIYGNREDKTPTRDLANGYVSNIKKSSKYLTEVGIDNADDQVLQSYVSDVGDALNILSHKDEAEGLPPEAIHTATEVLNQPATVLLIKQGRIPDSKLEPLQRSMRMRAGSYYKNISDEVNSVGEKLKGYKPSISIDEKEGKLVYKVAPNTPSDLLNLYSTNLRILENKVSKFNTAVKALSHSYGSEEYNNYLLQVIEPFSSVKEE